ncbi:hypothetical protein ACH5RR_037752 [Cinchona calisaya]|uniref:Bulb-type lectin domain-containing protein n=1 Tax=Cinchona calisaya TaxID=153742 RepID=A0ABD2Y8E9_9GENT
MEEITVKYCSTNEQLAGILTKSLSKEKFNHFRSLLAVCNFVSREISLVNAAGFLEVIKPGLVILCDDTNRIIWTSFNSSRSAQSSILQLLDTGNLVVKDSNDNNKEMFLWQSVDYPTDTLLPGMKVGRNFVTGLEIAAIVMESVVHMEVVTLEILAYVDVRTIILNGSEVKKREIIAISLPFFISVVLFGLIFMLYCWRKNKKLSKLTRKGIPRHIHDKDYTDELLKKDLELPSFDLSTIMKATDNFSNHNKLGDGGLGTTYKGLLEEG